jgi:two-component system response regulator NreC
MTARQIRVLLADDHVMVREGLATLLANDGQIDVVGQTADGPQTVEMARALNPQVVVLDITMPRLDGLEVCRELRSRPGGPAVLILTMHDQEQFVQQALRAGASGYLLKEAAAGQLVEALKAVAAGGTYISPGLPRPSTLRGVRQGDDAYARLTARQRQVLRLVAEGKTNRQIAEELGLSPKTIDTHRSALMRKLDIHDQTSLVKFAIRKGIISVG